MSRYLSPSMLSSDFSCLAKDVAMINESEADFFHLDVMDGLFVPNITFGFPVISHIKKLAARPLDVHLMIMEPERYFERFCEAGADWLSIHIENSTHLHRSLHRIRQLGMKAGVVLNPHTGLHTLDYIAGETDLILIMGVNPGFGGQVFIKNTVEKVSRLKELLLRSGSKALIGVDGGVDLSNAALLYNSGADMLVAGHAVFSAPDPVAMIGKIKNAE